MNKFEETIKQYREKNSLSISECAERLDISEDLLNDIENSKSNLSEMEQKQILEKINQKNKTSKRIIGLLDFIFRFGSTVMALVVLLLCINGYNEANTLIALLSVGVVCSSLTMLPKIEK